MKVEIDKNSGFCFGVINAIKLAEEVLEAEGSLYCLGDIVHNGEEVARLKKKGLITIDREKYMTLKNCKVLIRAHGEPPATYKTARLNNIELIDGTCPVVLKLQDKIEDAFESTRTLNGQVIIYGRKGHAEVQGLVGQTDGEAFVVEDFSDLDQIDFSRPVHLFSQTTKSREGFARIKDEIERRINKQQGLTGNFKCTNSVCGQVANRAPKLKKFSEEHDVIIFVSGKKSSNGKMLFEECKKINPASYFVSTPGEVDLSWFSAANNVGVCGATSTPLWLMQKIADLIMNNIGKVR